MSEKEYILRARWPHKNSEVEEKLGIKLNPWVVMDEEKKEKYADLLEPIVLFDIGTKPSNICAVVNVEVSYLRHLPGLKKNEN